MLSKNQINNIAMKCNVKNGEISDEDIYKLCGVAGLSYNDTFKGIKNISGNDLNQLISLAHQATRKQEELSKKNEKTRIAGIEDLAKQSNLLESDDDRLDRISTEVFKSWKESKKCNYNA